MLHVGEHEETIMRHVVDGGAGDGGQAETAAQVAQCDECVTFVARLVEDAIVARSPVAKRAEALLDEVLVWMAVKADAKEPVLG